ncbi:exo-alpha-sialidase [Verrucomicrobium sp. GAS474]|uniref:exo-alpha-sialidase n=1 Tax=Verrucomicrobium sp. GAS474 TaxID=1882831 RepID=UPI0012FF5CD3|nr:exo-alpha-sialidase [Verrucomicrobium sp. GAS474]
MLCLPLSAEAGEEAVHWESSGWGGGGFFWSAVFHPTKKGVLYMGGDVLGIYKTDDSGKQWRLINNGLPSYGVFSLAVTPASPESIYALTVNGPARSLDGGEHWTANPVQKEIVCQKYKSIRAIAADPVDADLVYVGSPKGKIFKSEDGAKTWKEVYALAQAGTVFSVVINPRQPTQVFGATATAGIVESDDRGVTWKELATPKKAAHITVSPSDGVLYGAFFDQGVYKSADGGKTWTKTAMEANAKNNAIEVVVNPQDANTVYCLAADHSAWAGAVYTSHDAGATWTRNNRMKPDLENDPTNPKDPDFLKTGTGPMSSVTNLALSPNFPNDLFISANWRSAYSEDGGKTWAERARGADISCVTDIRFFKNRTYAANMDEGVLMSENNGANWKAIWPLSYQPKVSGDVWRVAISEGSAGDRIVAAASPWNNVPRKNVILLSEDGGATPPAVIDAGLPDYLPKANTMWDHGYLRALAADPNDAKVFYAGIDGDPEGDKTGGGVFKSEDGGYTWKQLPVQPGSRRMYYGLAVDPTNSKRIFWGTCGNGGGLYRSEDGGNSWSYVFKDEGWIFNLHVSAEGIVYAAGKNLWASADHGTTWKKISNFDASQAIMGLETKPGSPNTIWISRVTWGSDAGGGIYKTTDGGATWSEITGDIPYRKPLVLRYNAATGELWTGFVGLFKTKQ